MSKICAVLEHTHNTLHEHSAELLSELVDLAQRQPQPTTVSAVLLTSQQAEPPDISFLPKLGVHHLYLLEHSLLAHYSTESYVSALAWFIQEYPPLLLATSATPNGRDWTPRLATQLHLPFVPNCLSLDLHDDSLFALRPIYEGRAYAQIRTILRGHTALATLIPGVRGTPQNTNTRRPRFIAGTADLSAYEPHQPSSSTTQSSLSSSPLEITHLLPEIHHNHNHERIRQISIQAPSPEEIELDAAERIVAGGRGIGQAGFPIIASFAHLLGASVGATRVATDLGWIEHTRQIGTTGKTVRPRLYIACGISGAAQHTSGMSEAQTVIAINPDRSAPIFALADLGLLGDANQILPLAAKMLEQP